jgi:hypothetical protein
MPGLENSDQVQAIGDSDIFELVYQGPDVDDGSMSAREVAEVISGITRLFSTVAHERDLGDEYELRVRDIEHNSFHLVFEAIAYAKSNPVAASAISAGAGVGLNAVTNTVSGAYKVITDVGALLTAKKKARGERIAKISSEFTDREIRLNLPDGPSRVNEGAIRAPTEPKS